MAATMLLVSVTFRVQPHKRSEVLSAVDHTLAHMRRASGCVGTRLCSDAEDPHLFTMLSEWQDTATADAFLSSREFQAFRGIRILLRDEPALVLDEVSSRVIRSLRS